MAFSRATLVQRIRFRMNDNPFVTACTEAMDTTETDMDVASTTKFDVGDIVEFSDDGERLLVTALFSATVLTVIRNFDGSSGAAVGTGTSHSSGVLVYKNPIYWTYQIHDVILETLRGLWPHVYKEVNYSLTPVTTGDPWYELDDAASDTSVIRELSSVRQVTTSSPTGVFEYGTRRGGYPARLVFNAPVAKAGSAVALYLPKLHNTTNAVLVNGIAPLVGTFSTPNYTELTDGVSVDCVMAGAIAKLLTISEVSRVTQEDITMAEESVKPGVRTSISQDWERRSYEARRRWERELEIYLPRRFERAGDGGL